MRVSTSAETAVAQQRVTWELDVLAAAAGVACPALVVHADRDAVVPLGAGRPLASAIPGARFVQIESENHMLLPQEPARARLMSEVHDFLGRRSTTHGSSVSRLRHAGKTPREIEVVEGIAQGLANAEIALRLGPSRKTVRNLVTRIFDQRSAQSRPHAIVLAREAASARGKARRRRAGPR